MRRFPLILLLVLAVITVVAITPGGALQRRKSQAARPATAASECHGWSYDGSDGQNHWATLFPSDCARRAQSPVDIIYSTPRALPAIGISYRPSRLTVNRVEYAPRVTYDPGSSISYAGMTYNLEQFHFHLPGEHRISDRGYVMEMHLVHKTPDGRHSAAIGVLFRAEGPTNPAFQPIIDNLPPPGSDNGGTGQEINASNLLPATRSYYKYTGSLTTPCCTEPVLWLVLANPVRISVDQLRKFEYSQGGKHNSRRIQRRIRADH